MGAPYTVRRDGKLYVRLQYVVNGKRRSRERLVANQREAVSVLAEMKAELARHGVESFDADRMLFDELVVEFRRAHPRTKEFMLAPLDHFRGRRLRSITYADIVLFAEERRRVPSKRWIEHEARRLRMERTRRPIAPKVIERERKPATINRELEVLRQVLLFAMRHGWLLRNPFTAGPALISKTEEDRRDRIPSPEEEERLLAACEDPQRWHLRVYIVATRDTGLRRSALQELTGSCVDWERQLLRIPAGNRYKQRPKVLGLTERLARELLRWHQGRPADATPLLPPVADFKRAWRTACRLSQVEGLRFNDLRHGYATDLMEAGVPQHFAMRLAGHSTAEIHDRYANIDERLARDAADALSKLHKTR